MQNRLDCSRLLEGDTERSQGRVSNRHRTNSPSVPWGCSCPRAPGSLCQAGTRLSPLPARPGIGPLCLLLAKCFSVQCPHLILTGPDPTCRLGSRGPPSAQPSINFPPRVTTSPSPAAAVSWARRQSLCRRPCQVPRAPLSQSSWEQCRGAHPLAPSALLICGPWALGGWPCGSPVSPGGTGH